MSGTIDVDMEKGTITFRLPALAQRRDRAEVEAQDAQGALAIVADPSFKIVDDAQYAEVTQLVRDVESKWDFLDDERKVTVKPLNDEVKRINDWYRPALTALKQIAECGRKVMGAYVLEKRRLEAKLKAEAAAAAQKVLAHAPDAVQQVKEVVKAGAQAAAPKQAGVTVKPVYGFRVVNPDVVDRRFCSPDEKKLAAWIEEHGLNDVPAGVEVWEDVNFTIRRAK